MTDISNYTQRIEQSKADWANLGYTITRQLTNATGTNAVYELAKAGRKYFGKISLTDFPQRMAADKWWCETVARLIADDPTAPFTVPRIFASGDSWMIADWIEAPLLAADDFAAGDAAMLPVVERLVDSLVWLDKQPITSAPDDDASNTAKFNDLLKKVDGWLELPLAEGRVSAAATETAKQFVRDNQQFIKPGLQHGDFVPWHCFELPDGRPCFFDAEHASANKPRYYDLAYLYTRLYTRSAAPEAARTSLKSFMAKAGVNETDFANAFLPVVTLRGFGMQIDALNDRQSYDYAPAARDLLDRCNTARLASFL